MKAVDRNLLQLLHTAGRFVVPIYQRTYAWDKRQCEQLWDDIIAAGSTGKGGDHFTGSIVYVREEGEPNLLIDGQQRVTTITLLLAALSVRMFEMDKDERAEHHGFDPNQIRDWYLTNAYEHGDAAYKLILTRGDRETLIDIIDGQSPDEVEKLEGHSRHLLANYRFFIDKLHDDDCDIAAVCRGLSRLVIVDVTLDIRTDNPQLVFESMNSTGKTLSQTDLIRNYVLMNLPRHEQEVLYRQHWYRIESLFRGGNERRFDEYVRNYLTMRGLTVRTDAIYDAFKSLSGGDPDRNVALVKDLHRYADHYADFALGAEQDPVLADLFRELNSLRATVTYPFLLAFHDRYKSGGLGRDDYAAIVRLAISYLVRRSVCGIPTNSTNRTFAWLSHGVDMTGGYRDGVEKAFASLDGQARFPGDDEFEYAIANYDLYGNDRCKYVLDGLEQQYEDDENKDSKETVHVSAPGRSIEHIMPQTLTDEWKKELGPDWEKATAYMHTLGNLTLTGYNSEYSNNTFQEKRDNPKGYADSPLLLNRELGETAKWDLTAIRERAARLAKVAARHWPAPTITVEAHDDAPTEATPGNIAAIMTAIDDAINDAVPDARAGRGTHTYGHYVTYTRDGYDGTVTVSADTECDARPLVSIVIEDPTDNGIDDYSGLFAPYGFRSIHATVTDPKDAPAVALTITTALRGFTETEN